MLYNDKENLILIDPHLFFFKFAKKVMKKIIFICCLLALLNCESSDSDTSIPEIETRVELSLDIFQYRKSSFSSFQSLTLPLIFEKGKESLWDNYSYKSPTKGIYKIYIKGKCKYSYNGSMTAQNPCGRLDDFGISISASGLGLARIENCNEYIVFEGSVEKNLSLDELLKIEIKLYSSKLGPNYVANMDIDINDCQVIIEKL